MGTNETILRQAYERIGTGDTEQVFDVLADDVVWKSSGNPQILQSAGEWRGKVAVRDYFVKSRTDWDVQMGAPLEIIAHNDTRFVVRLNVEAVNRRTNGRVQFEKVDLVTMKDGKCASYSEIFDTAMLERAAGHGPVEG